VLYFAVADMRIVNPIDKVQFVSIDQLIIVKKGFVGFGGAGGEEEKNHHSQTIFSVAVVFDFCIHN
jgi:hypothetical protein